MRAISVILTALTALLMVSCNQKRFDDEADNPRCTLRLDLTYDLPWHVVFEGGTDWQSVWDADTYGVAYDDLRPSIPEGARAVVYDDKGGYEVFNLPAMGGDIDLNPGAYTMLLYNNDSEYLLFGDLFDSASLTATTRARSRSSFVGSPYVDNETNENTISAPDMLFARQVGGFQVDMTNDGDHLAYQLKPLVYKYVVRYHFDRGLNYVTLSRGVLAGMASTVYLSDGHTDDVRCSILFDIENPDAVRIADASTGEGVLQTVVNSFGVAGFPNSYYTRSDNTYGLNLEVRLSNGKVKNYDFDISQQILKQPRGGVIDVYGLAVSDDDGSEAEGSFDVDVDGWGDYIDIPIM